MVSGSPQCLPRRSKIAPWDAAAPLVRTSPRTRPLSPRAARQALKAAARGHVAANRQPRATGRRSSGTVGTWRYDYCMRSDSGGRAENGSFLAGLLGVADCALGCSRPGGFPRPFFWRTMVYP